MISQFNSSNTTQWREKKGRPFLAEERAHTTVLIAGLTIAHDELATSALKGIGYRIQTLPCPDNDALRFGKEFGNRGQCNPTYFTVGNLVKYLVHLRDERGIPVEEIIEKYVFLTAGACGPCRFGMYVTEYRKALRDAGFEGFRVVLFQQNAINQATGKNTGLQINREFAVTVLKAILVGDAFNALGYRLRPYEVEKGKTDAVIEVCKRIVRKSLESRKGFWKALWQCRKLFQTIEVNRTLIKPKVSIIGEFWAMTTEGDGNYKMQRFLESEGAEVDIQLVVSWLLYMLWQARWDTEQREMLRKEDGGRFGLRHVRIQKRKISVRVGETLLRGAFSLISNLVGLKGYKLPDMDALASISNDYYDNYLRGGEGHMEVGKLIQNVAEHKANMTLSIKPFGCMPSSSVSDGVQAHITEKYPSAIFLPIETSGDGAANIYSRVQMQLFKAKQAAEKEVEEILHKKGLTKTEFESRYEKSPFPTLHESLHVGACTAANVVNDWILAHA